MNTKLSSRQCPFPFYPGIFVYQPTPNVFETASLADAITGCSSLGPGIRLATLEEVTQASNMGSAPFVLYYTIQNPIICQSYQMYIRLQCFRFGRCNEVWVADGNIYNIINSPCATFIIGVNGPRPRTTANVICIGSGFAGEHKYFVSFTQTKLNAQSQNDVFTPNIPYT